MNGTTDSEVLHHIDTRLSIVEAELAAQAQTKKWVQGVVVAVCLHALAGIVAFSKLYERVDSLNLDVLQTNVSTALHVLGSHGTELETLRTEQARLRGVIDAIRTSIDSKTQDRFTGRDGARLEQRVLRLEDWRLEHQKERASP